MNKLEDLLSLPTLFLLLGIYIVAYGIRQFLESVWPTLSSKTATTVPERIWESFVLPVMPAVLGAVFCLVCPPRLFAYPAVAAATWVSRVLYGLVVGWFAAWGYAIISSIIKKKWNIPFPDGSITSAVVETRGEVIQTKIVSAVTEAKPPPEKSS